MKKHQIYLLRERYKTFNPQMLHFARKSVLEAPNAVNKETFKSISINTLLYAPVLYIIINLDWTSNRMLYAAIYTLFSFIAFQFIASQIADHLNWRGLRKAVTREDFRLDRLSRYASDTKKVQFLTDAMALITAAISTYMLYSLEWGSTLLNIALLPLFILCLYAGINASYKTHYVVIMSENIKEVMTKQ